MKSATRLLQVLYREESGQDLIEYALIGAFTILLAVAAVNQAGQGISNLYNTIENGMRTATGS